MRLVQLTDLHLLESPGGRVRKVDVRAGFERLLRAARRYEPEYYVLTGDLADDGKKGSYEALRELLGDVADQTVVLPGNHDDPTLLRALFRGQEGAPGRVGFTFHAGGWHVIGVDTKVTGRVLGRIGPEQLTWLDRELSAGVEPAILFLHHPPIRVGTHWLDASRLADAEQLGELARQHVRLRIIACGHAHMDFSGRLGGSEVFVTPSTAFQFVAGSWWPRIGGRRGQGTGFRVFDLAEPHSTEVVFADSSTTNPPA